MLNFENMKTWRRVCDLELTELETLTRNNLKFRDLVAEVAIDNVYDQLQNDYLFGAPFYYEYSAVYETRVNFDNRYGYGARWSEIIDWIKHVNNDYGFLYDVESGLDPVEMAVKCRDLQEKLDLDNGYYFDFSTKDRNRIETRLAELQNRLENMIKCAIDSYLEGPDDIDYLVNELECMTDYAFNDLYIDDIGRIKKLTVENIA